MFEKRGVDVVAIFDVDERIIGKKIGDSRVYHMDALEEKLSKYSVDIAILTLPKDRAAEVAERLKTTCVRGIWNFTGKEIAATENTVVENVHIGDSLMTLCYEVAQKAYKSDGEN